MPMFIRVNVTFFYDGPFFKNRLSYCRDLLINQSKRGSNIGTEHIEVDDSKNPKQIYRQS